MHIWLRFENVQPAVVVIVESTFCSVSKFSDVLGGSKENSIVLLTGSVLFQLKKRIFSLLESFAKVYMNR